MSFRSTPAIAVLALATLLVGTLAGRQFATGIPSEDVVARQDQAIERATRIVQAQFEILNSALDRTGREIATDPALVAALRELEDGQGSQDGVDALVRYLSGRRAPELSSIEVYDPIPRLRGWQGFSMPLDSGPGDSGFLSTSLVRLAVDGDQRRALVGWYPVLDNGRAIGAVRVLRLIEVRVPVKNDYLDDVSLAEDWSRATGLRIRLESDARPSSERVVFRDVDGTFLFSAHLEPPSSEALLAAQRVRYNEFAALWAALLILVVGAWGTVRARRALASFSMRSTATVLMVLLLRMGLVWLRVPGRWQAAKEPLAPLFDPVHLASNATWGLFSSGGDTILTALAAVLVAVLVVRDAISSRDDWVGPGVPKAEGKRAQPEARRAEAFARGLLLGLTAGVLYIALVWITRRLVLDSTLDYFARSGLLPQKLVVAVFVSLLLLGLAAALGSLAAGARLIPRGAPVRWTLAGAVAAALAMVVGASWVFYDLGLKEQLALLTFSGMIVGFSYRLPRSGSWPIQFWFLRTVLLVVVLGALLLYPGLERGVEIKERLRMEDAALAFAEERDPRVMLAITQVVRSTMDLAGREARAGDQYDVALEELLRGSLLASLGTYEVSVAVFNDFGDILGRNTAARTAAALARALQQDRADLALMRSIREQEGNPPLVIEKITSAVELDRFDYIGLAVSEVETGTAAGTGSRSGSGTRSGRGADMEIESGSATGTVPEVRWILVRASQKDLLPTGNTPFPRVLVPAGYYGSLYPDLSIAEFRESVLVRNFGSGFGRSLLDPEVAAEMRGRDLLWRTEHVRDRAYLTRYQRSTVQGSGPAELASGRSIVAVRAASINFFDRLYYLLRLTVAGLVPGLLVYGYGLYDRRRRGELPARRILFRDKVLSAFFAVGLVVVCAMGWLGLRVVTGETDRAVESWLRQHLDRVEDALALRAGPDEMPYRVLERTDVDSLAAQVGLDLNVYRGVELDAASRPQLVRDRLISQRIPIEAYNALFVSGFRFASVDERLGTFKYTAGYQALPDEQGQPRYVVSVPTLPEQERIEEERARTAAYLFGALLLLMLVVMVTAAVIANALSRPVARLQRGLQTVAEGRFERIGPMDSRDEVSELVGTFNQMQDQLVESRRLLANQERQLAWREMARQVAHEIKNPLTPMKLSVQHLRRAFQANPDGPAFSGLFERITSTLIDQTDALARIANEFSSFARMPLQKPEELDLNDVVKEAVSLMRENDGARVATALNPEPLPIMADREALRRMYINFLKNAVEAFEPGRDGHIEVTTEREVDPETGNVWAVSSVGDNGTGIEEELRDRIFNPSFSTKTSGTGLGLAIARNTVEEMGGRIGFETEVGVGTTFWVRIPLILTEPERG